MKPAVIGIFLLAVLAAEATVVFKTKAAKKAADGETIARQKKILDLLVGLGHKRWFKSDLDDFDIKSNAAHYTDPKFVNEFWYEYERGWLPQDQEFTLRSPKILRQTIKLFNLFYHAKDFDTLYKTACWARKHVHDVQFAYVLYVAVYHRSDCRGLVLPPLYEVFPSSFLSQEVIRKIYGAKMEGVHSLRAYDNSTGWQNYWQKMSTGNSVHRGYRGGQDNVEGRIDYFREDPGLSDYLAQLTIFYPKWLDHKVYPKIKYFRRGELFYYVFQQILARYTLERYANHLPQTDVLHWDQPIAVGYNPRVVHPSGHYMCPRPARMVPFKANPSGVWKTERLEWKIINDIDAGIIYYKRNDSYGRLPIEDVVNSWGNIVWGTPDAYDHRVYGDYFQSALDTIARMVKTGSKHYTTGALGIYLTSSRDPAFYMFLQRLMDIFRKHKDAIHSYTEKDLKFPGVKIESVQVGKLNTYFERFDVDATYGVPIPTTHSYSDYRYTGSIVRINHKPYTYRLTLTSDRQVEGVVRIFIGPKTSGEGYPLTLEQARSSYFELDRFPVKLTRGENVIDRNSKESNGFIRDKEGFTALYHRVKKSIATNEPFYVTDSLNCGLPDRLMIPKGSPEGRPLVFYTVVTPYEKKVVATPAEERQFESQIFCGGSKYYDGRPYGFPFDRRVDYEEVFSLPNFHREDVLVYHKQFQ